MGDMTKAILDCMGQPNLIDTSSIKKRVSDFESKELIDSTNNIKGSKVFIFSGTQDKVINQLVNKRGEDIYKLFGADIKTMYTLPAGHT